MKIKVMTYNIHHGKGMDKKVDLNRIADVISKSGADIIGLNEVDKNYSSRSDFIDQVQFLGDELKLHYAFSPSISLTSKKADGIRQYGNGLLSRFPILSSKNHLLNFIPGLIEGRSVLETTIEVNKKLLGTYVTHLSLNPGLHKKQSQFIFEKAKSPAIILGDWNMKPHSRKWGRVTANYRDVWKEAGGEPGLTYPSTKPRLRLDYIFVTEELKINDARVIDTEPIASDHLPVMATLSI
ncbi:endonuclease/exonuclease/phosphatase family protein [Bacillus sp. ISL-39]|uniref:endonuclease/exonuclease/phosphatase family protein n=1 Tax=Bacillus sp. ISL-39 TaxID=2819124 RepID=UPI003337C081